MVLWAHSRSAVSGVRHGLDEHCRSTALWASRFASVFGAGELAYVLGLFHDAGKASCAWQQRLLEVEGTANRVGVAHKQLGARLVFDVCGLAAMAVLGHHGGLTNPSQLRDVLTSLLSDDDDEAAARFLFAVPEASGVFAGRRLYPGRWRGVSEKLVWEMRLRMVFSALVDADHLDTAAHQRGLPGPQVAPPTDMRMLVQRFERRRAALIDDRGDEIGQLRSQVYEAAVAAAAGEPGLYRLAAPTGLGKTFAQGAFGLHHAAQWGKSRVIVAVPFITITEQNADVYRRLLDDSDEPVVLEHHSSVRFDERDDSQDPAVTSTRDRWARLAAENWDAPFVVTTTVQLFESLFGRRPSEVRKVHRLANAVVILDEVQALPTRLLLPILSGLRILAEAFGTTVLLTSATQPQFQALSVWKASETYDEVRIREIIADPQPLFHRARRVRYEWRLDPKPTWQEIADAVIGQAQAMVVVNSVADARGLFRLVSRHRNDVWHLSTRMCPIHRRAVLAKVTERLRAGRPTVLVATQLVEAGVDLSFPTVWRALAPADSLQQAAGRANRHGEHDEGGLVVVFDPAEGRRPTEYELACSLTVTHFGPDGAALDDQRALARYYEELYADLQLDQHRVDSSNAPVGQVVQRNREGLDFIAVSDGPLVDAGGSKRRDRKRAFRMITDESMPVAVLDHEDAARVEAMLADLAAGTVRAGAALRQLQPWIVQLRTSITQRPEVAALIDAVVGDLGVWKGAYDWDPRTARGVGLDEGSISTVF
ncbi:MULTISPECIES: CRISPR-associated helicase Cas3' [Nocardia]|uniref:CRISPR-associated helicase/endonuclease Cas3 n=1 Tax=Nocardia sputorum TaxID=2984338 RepID=A0ABM8D133_9NOCA|nr:CRISPR-associated helicase Cas3' [Nocardia sputorum]BDU01014.1 CRISPR-associated helicase/endonuclease Cas3 [Nocardia sputorum]